MFIICYVHINAYIINALTSTIVDCVLRFYSCKVVFLKYSTLLKFREARVCFVPFILLQLVIILF